MFKSKTFRKEHTMLNGHSAVQKNNSQSSPIADSRGKKRKREGPLLSNSGDAQDGVKIERHSYEVKNLHRATSPEVTKEPILQNKKSIKRPDPLGNARSQLPIASYESEIRQGLSAHRNVMILVGETGSGKSTQVPQFLLKEPWCGNGCIAITQPRRVAAISLAKRVAEEMGTPLGRDSPTSKVGYSVRFDNNASQNTRIKYLTEGMLVQEMLRDPWLKNYAAVIVDEVHERSVNVDLIMGFLKRIVTGGEKAKRKRHQKELKVVIMSATAEVGKIFQFFQEGFSEKMDEKFLSNGDTNAGQQEREDSPDSWSGISSNVDEAKEKPTQPLDLITSGGFEEVYSDHVSTSNIKGRQYAVEVMYLSEPTTDFVEASLKTVVQVHYKEPLPGDILVFLTGQDLVEALVALIDEYAATMGPEVPKLLTLPLFAALSQKEQQRVFQPTPQRTRKVIISTNIAETSLTIPGVRYVVDCGLAKVKEYRAALSLDSLLVKPISQSSAIQRKGRAGRQENGKCYRLYTEKEYLGLAPATTPEILRCDLAAALLTMKARGVNDVTNFPFLDPPTPEAMRKALLQLHRLGAISSTGEISRIGTQMARLPLAPQLARMVIAAAQPGRDCLLDIIDIVSCLTVESIFQPLTSEDKKEEAQTARRELFCREGDHLTLMATLQAYASVVAEARAEAERQVIAERKAEAKLTMKADSKSEANEVKPVVDESKPEAGEPKPMAENNADDNDKSNADLKVEVKRKSKADRKSNPIHKAQAAGKAWAYAHFVNHRAIQNVMNVRKQLRIQCQQLRLLARNLDVDAEHHLPSSSFPPNQSSSNLTSPSTSTPTPEKQEILLRTLLTGFAQNTARLCPDGSYKTLEGNQTVGIHPGSMLYGRKVEAIVYNELVWTTRCWARGVSAVRLDWWMDALEAGEGEAASKVGVEVGVRQGDGRKGDDEEAD